VFENLYNLVEKLVLMRKKFEKYGFFKYSNEVFRQKSHSKASMPSKNRKNTLVKQSILFLHPQRALSEEASQL